MTALCHCRTSVQPSIPVARIVIKWRENKTFEFFECHLPPSHNQHGNDRMRESVVVPIATCNPMYKMSKCLLQLANITC